MCLFEFHFRLIKYVADFAISGGGPLSFSSLFWDHSHFLVAGFCASTELLLSPVEIPLLISRLAITNFQVCSYHECLERDHNGACSVVSLNRLLNTVAGFTCCNLFKTPCHVYTYTKMRVCSKKAIPKARLLGWALGICLFGLNGVLVFFKSQYATLI